MTDGLTVDSKIARASTVPSRSTFNFKWWIVGFIVFLLSLFIAFIAGAYVQTQRLKPNADQLADSFEQMSEMSAELKIMREKSANQLKEFNKQLGVKESDIQGKSSTIDLLNDSIDWLRRNPEKKVVTNTVTKNVCVGGQWTGVSRSNAAIAERNRLKQEDGRIQ